MHRLVLVPHYASVLAFLLPTVLHGQDDPTVSSGRREAASLFQNVAANWQHLDNYDVMIVETRQQTRDKPKSVSRVRMIADHGRNVYLFVGTGSYGNSKGFAAYYLSAEGGEAWMRFSENEPAMPVWKQSARTPSISKALSISRFPDVRFVGSREYPARFLETPIDEYFSSDTGFAKDVKIEVIGEGNLEVVETFLPGRKSRIQRRVTFKGEMPVPIRLVFVRSARDGTQPWINNDESIAWKENKGVFLPSEIRGTSRTHPEREPQNFGVTFKWLVVNDTDALPRFSVDALSDDQRLRELIAEN